MDIIDRKFKFVAVNPCNNKYHTQEDAIVFCAKDEAVPYMLQAYKEECKRLGANSEHIESIRLLANRVMQYQKDIEHKVPDTDGDCEIDRCIGGLGL